MKIDILTLFPEMCGNYLGESIIGRARKAGFIEVNCRNIRDYTTDKHRRVDDKAYGGGTGMVMQAQPIYDCVMSIVGDNSARLIYMSPQGKPLNQKLVKELAGEQRLVILCGHYEGVDRRVLDELGFEEISIGDYVVTGGELPALILTDAVARLQEGVLPNQDAFTEESHYNGLLEEPKYTRPEVWRGRKVPDVLISGHHANIEKWKKEQSRKITQEKRPDMLT
ncbi:MAG: tRNA (guanosine(37)-N1)-methyltransferase TrmD [Oscillospiraceae bacterium]|jgi:tRNA (guanine37-N1)-methyltransferase|nr:tRNA (guanosine(37)-N1)-methyltransferase TrmD [Oscillospiraceae bacterium]